MFFLCWFIEWSHTINAQFVTVSRDFCRQNFQQSFMTRTFHFKPQSFSRGPSSGSTLGKQMLLSRGQNIRPLGRNVAVWIRLLGHERLLESQSLVWEMCCSGAGLTKDCSSGTSGECSWDCRSHLCWEWMCCLSTSLDKQPANSISEAVVITLWALLHCLPCGFCVFVFPFVLSFVSSFGQEPALWWEQCCGACWWNLVWSTPKHIQSYEGGHTSGLHIRLSWWSSPLVVTLVIYLHYVVSVGFASKLAGFVSMGKN